MRITAAQLDPVVGDISGNVRRMAQQLEAYAADRADPDRPDLVVFSELFLTGYPPKDLLEHTWFVSQVLAAIESVKALSLRFPETGILFGAPVPTTSANGKGLYNAALLIYRGELVGQANKKLLPTYDVFDEARYFDPAPALHPIPFKGERLGVHICEDAWTEPALWPRRYVYDCDPIRALAEQGVSLFINISASPFSVGKETVRHGMIRDHARRYNVPFLYVNQVGGNDELVFDGRSLFLDAQGEPLAVYPSFREHCQTVDTAAPVLVDGFVPEEEIATVYDALVLGLRDYAAKTGFTRAVVGLSGGIDSAITCALAARAFGPENVLGVSMPSPYSSQGSLDDARQVAANLGVAYRVVPISGIYAAYLAELSGHFADRAPDVTEENIQARIRGNILMAFSNKYGYLVLSTGNKSELAVGYCTLYGDMSGGLAVISDVPKTMVYQLARYMNRSVEVIPPSSIEKPPSAELRPNQTDQDTLPPYPVLDEILRCYVEEGCSIEQMVAQGMDEKTVRWVVRTVDRNEYKRKQAAPGLRVTTKAFGVGRRMPIAARYSAEAAVPES
ncbi:MAG: NAD+ synthase [Anaerolineae bacterium]